MTTTNAFTRRFALALAALCVLQPAASAAAEPAAAAASHRDLAQEARNLALVLEFSEAVFNRHDLSVAERLLAEDYIQHNPRMASGRAAFVAYFTGMMASRPTVRSQTVRTATSGDLVFVHAHSSDGSGKGDLAIVNIYRVANGKIAEHWDVVQPVPENAANTNTMF